jgi:hypothetical protein
MSASSLSSTPFCIPEDCRIYRLSLSVAALKLENDLDFPVVANDAGAGILVFHHFLDLVHLPNQ